MSVFCNRVPVALSCREFNVLCLKSKISSNAGTFLKTTSKRQLSSCVALVSQASVILYRLHDALSDVVEIRCVRCVTTDGVVLYIWSDGYRSSFMACDQRQRSLAKPIGIATLPSSSAHLDVTAAVSQLRSL
jgi:hypothetical protein